jgi:hypothetical protein
MFKMAGVSFLVSFIFISGCQAVEMRPTELPTLTPGTAAPPTLTPTWTKEPTVTSSPMVLPSLTAEPTETATATLPVFSREEVETNILQMLMDESDCELHCWWGLAPGKTTWAETKYFLLSRGIIPDSYYRNIPWDIYSSLNYLDQYSTSVLFEFYVIQRVVQGIKINVNSYYDVQNFKLVMKNFSPEAMAATFGSPTQVWLYIEGELAEASEYTTVSLWLFYSPYDIYVEFHGSIYYEETFNYCPTFEANQINDITLFFSFAESDVSIFDWAKPEYYEPMEIEHATGLTVEEFYNLYQQDNGVVCIKSPRELWK